MCINRLLFWDQRSKCPEKVNLAEAFIHYNMKTSIRFVLLLMLIPVLSFAQDSTSSALKYGVHINYQYFPRFDETNLFAGLSVRSGKHFFGLESQMPQFAPDDVFIHFALLYKYRFGNYGLKLSSHLVGKLNYRYNHDGSNPLVKWTQRKIEPMAGLALQWQPAQWLYGYVHMLAGPRFYHDGYEHFKLQPEWRTADPTYFSYLLEVGGGLEFGK